MTDHKACTKCKQTLPATAEHFNRCSASRDGLRYQCRDCEQQYQLEYNRKRRADPAYRQYEREYQRERYEDIKRSYYQQRLSGNRDEQD
jgi:hypothetical protein